MQRVPLVLLALAGCIVALVAFSWRSSQLGYVTVPDAMLYYSPSTLQGVLREFGEAGRELYLWSQLSIDMLFPAAYGYLLYSTGRRIAAEHGVRFYRLAVVAAASDMLENLLLVAVVLLYPADAGPAVALSQAAVAATLVKSTMLALFLLSCAWAAAFRLFVMKRVVLNESEVTGGYTEL